MFYQVYHLPCNPKNVGVGFVYCLDTDIQLFVPYKFLHD